MRYIFTAILFLTASVFAQNGIKVLHLNKIDTDISVDGLIDPAWGNADSVSDFIQYSPYHNTEPTRRTVAKVLTTDDAIYCLMICYDNSGEILKNTGMLDDNSGDKVSFMIDTFGDKRTGYKFAVSATGVRSDCRLLDDARNRDYSWDGIWFADSKIYDWGFIVEMEIPYKSIQYDENLTEWGLDFDRWRPQNSEDIYWCEYDETAGQRIAQFGKLVFENFKPTVKGLNLELYPVGIAKATYLQDDKYKIDPNAGLDIFYNPSPALTFQFTANPDFAQIEADPYDFNISRFESYFDEKRPFFTQGKEVFTASGRQRNSGFYRPMEFFYSRRIGKKLSDGTEVPLSFGTKAFGRMGDWEYGGFIARTEEAQWWDDDDSTTVIEPKAFFGSARVSTQIMENSSIGVLFVGKHTAGNNYGVLDIDGALRGRDYQLAYQIARSFKNSQGDFAFSAGLTNFMNTWITAARTRYVGKNFDIDQIGYVPWKGTAEFVAFTGPRWYFEEGYVRSILLYAGPIVNWEDADNYTDLGLLLGYNMQFRDNWGGEINFTLSKSKDEGVYYDYYSTNLSTWYNISPVWNGNLWGGYEKTYNFSREYLAFYSWVGGRIEWTPLDILELGTEINMWIEGNPGGGVEDITYNARPTLSLTPFNNFNIRLYVDNLYTKSSDKMEQLIMGLLFSYNFSPKSWIYFALNEVHDRSDEYNSSGTLLPNRMHTRARAAVLKIKYLYYF